MSFRCASGVTTMSPSRLPSRAVLSDWTACRWLASQGKHAPIGQVSGFETGFPALRPAPAGLLHLGPRMDVAVQGGSGRALPRLPRSKARPGSKHVAVVLAVGRAPASAVFDEARALFQFSPSPVAPYPSKASPRQQPYRVTAALALPPGGFPPPDCRVATTFELVASNGPQGLAPLSNSLPIEMLPSRSARSFPGLAYRQDFSAIPRMRSHLPVLTECRVGRVGGPCRSAGDPP